VTIAWRFFQVDLIHVTGCSSGGETPGQIANTGRSPTNDTVPVASTGSATKSRNGLVERRTGEIGEQQDRFRSGEVAGEEGGGNAAPQAMNRAGPVRFAFPWIHGAEVALGVDDFSSKDDGAGRLERCSWRVLGCRLVEDRDGFRADLKHRRGSRSPAGWPEGRTGSSRWKADSSSFVKPNCRALRGSGVGEACPDGFDQDRCRMGEEDALMLGDRENRSGRSDPLRQAAIRPAMAVAARIAKTARPRVKREWAGFPTR